MTLVNDANIAALQNLLADYRAEYIERFVSAQREADLAMVEELAAVGGRTSALFPPTLVRKELKQQQAARARLSAICEFDQYAKDEQGAPIRGGVYTYSSEKHEAAMGAPRAAAEANFHAYVTKLADKVDGEITDAVVEGDLWSGSTLTLTVDGQVQTWKTKCIINRSALGTLFNQFPTRRAK